MSSDMTNIDFSALAEFYDLECKSAQGRDGSGVPKIYHNWQDQHWRRPILSDQIDPEQTMMELRMVTLVPTDVLAELEARLGQTFTSLPEPARLALITASSEGVLSHARLRQMSSEHPADITKMLGRLVKDGLLQSRGIGRGTLYALPWQMSEPLAYYDSLPPELEVKSPELEAKPPELELYADWATIPASVQSDLLVLAEPVSGKGKVPRDLLQSTVLALCLHRYLGLRVLAHVLQRDPDDLRKRTLIPMVKEGRLSAAFASAQNPRQAYTTVLPRDVN